MGNNQGMTVLLLWQKRICFPGLERNPIRMKKPRFVNACTSVWIAMCRFFYFYLHPYIYHCWYNNLLLLLPPPLLFLLPSSANAVSFAANTATDVNSSSSFALSLLLLRLLLWFTDIACLVSSIAYATTTTSVSASASSATPAQFLPPPLILYL